MVIRFARENDYNLIITGYRGHSAIERLVVGSTASTIGRYAHCSVLIYRPGSELP
jgi:nucleotide-binding universal stress UspA family protein